MSSGRRTGQLHLNRVSGSETIYFVTGCTFGRRPGLLHESIAASVLHSIKAGDALRDTTTYAFTIMPEHWHWFFRMGNRLSLGRILARFKTQTRSTLGALRLEWQRDFYEHRLLPGESPEDYALYVFLNPYRAGLISWNEPWPFWWTAEPEALRFLAHLDGRGCPPPEWVDLPVPMGVRDAE